MSTTVQPKHQSFGFSFPSIVYQLRTVQVVALFLEITVLYMEHDRIGLYFLFPLGLHLVNIYHTGKRLYYNIDGRYDLKQMNSVKDIQIKARYAFAVFGSLLLALVTHFIAGPIPSNLSALIYNLANYASLAASGGVLTAELYETFKPKTH
ncbi:hypothetical protein Tcan_09608 [Toxocara canis]|uniref:DUF7087 domain-containing protein n=1 Tax=Toxocara canis TaxID=6265 RepID=A0A0B2VE53_TOXCA|nr:hypothetical protein Tcan_09608 [Toxocara canis]